jgi:phage-related protein
MPTFTWVPDVPASESSAPRVSSVELGGYRQRPAYGINPYRDTWSLRFSSRSVSDTAAIYNFLDARKGVETFTWTPPFGETAQFVCTKWTTTLDSCRFSTVEATFELAYVPGGTNPVTQAAPTTAFTWIVDYAARKEYDTRVKPVEYGDGYIQRYRFGLNPQREVWSVQLSKRSNAERDAIRTFLRGARGVTTFQWTDPQTGALGYYTCTDWTISYNGFNNNDVQLQLTRTIEPLRRELLPIVAPILSIAYTKVPHYDYYVGQTPSCHIDSAGNTYYCTDYLAPSGSVGDNTLVVTKRSAAGELQWCKHIGLGIKQFSGPYTVYTTALAPQDAGIYMLIAFSDPYYGTYYHIHKLRFDGVLVWSKRVNMPTLDYIQTARIRVNTITGNLFIQEDGFSNGRVRVLSPDGVPLMQYSYSGGSYFYEASPNIVFDNRGNTYAVNYIGAGVGSSGAAYGIQITKIAPDLSILTTMAYGTPSSLFIPSLGIMQCTGTDIVLIQGSIVVFIDTTTLAVSAAYIDSSSGYGYFNSPFAVTCDSTYVCVLAITPAGIQISRFDATGVVSAAERITADPSTGSVIYAPYRSISKLPGKDMYAIAGRDIIVTFNMASPATTISVPAEYTTITSTPLTGLPYTFSATSAPTVSSPTASLTAGSFTVTDVTSSMPVTDATTDFSWFYRASDSTYIP